jgi:ribosomal protein S18 acetylase RimI-like enzyme
VRRLIPTLDLVHRVNEAALAYTMARMKVLERIPGNPIGVAFQTLEGATALVARDLPSRSFNSVVGLSVEHARRIESLIEWYRERGATAHFEIAAGDHEPALGRELARLGFFQSSFHAALVGEPANHYPAHDEAIERVVSASDMEDFLAAYVVGWAIPDAIREQFKAKVRSWRYEPGWSLYVARIDQKPAASAILFVRDGVGYLADCAVDPAFRRRGLHAALLRRRVRDASAANADLICSGADFLSGSHRNMERLGMRLLFLRAVWTSLT